MNDLLCRAISEQTARRMIQEGLAGYWEVSLRDSISKTPIPHSVATVVYTQGGWYIVSTSLVKVVDMGYQPLSEAVNGVHMVGNLSKIEVDDEHFLVELFKKDIEEKGRHL